MLHRVCSASSSTKESLSATFVSILQQFGSERFNQVLSQRNDRRYVPLHTAIFSKNLAAVELLIQYEAQLDTKCHGTPPLQLAIRAAAQPNGYEFGSKCFSLLLGANTNPFAKDDNGYSVLHLLAMYNFPEMMNEFMSAVDIKSTINSQLKFTGQTALHLAAQYDSVDCAKLILTHDANSKATMKICGSTPLHVCAVYKSQKVWSLLLSLGNSPEFLLSKNNTGQTACDLLALDHWIYDASQQPSMICQHGSNSGSSSSSSTGIFSSWKCLDHHTVPPSQIESHLSKCPPENIHRLHVLIDPNQGILHSQTLQQQQQPNNASIGAVSSSSSSAPSPVTASLVVYDYACPPAPLADLLRVHDWPYLRRIEAACLNIDREQRDEAAAVGGGEGEGGEVTIEHLDGDTAISRGSWTAACCAAGSVIRAVDRVIAKEVSTAFCPIRPPGHHVGGRGASKSLTGSESHGFCLMNNISISAAYALNVHRQVIKKVAIVDFDVHHGNGTASTVRALKPSLDTMSLGGGMGGSMMDNNNGLFGLLYQPYYKPWYDHDDSDHVLFISVHGYGPPTRGLEALFPRKAAFYPGTGPTNIPRRIKPKPAVNEQVQASSINGTRTANRNNNGSSTGKKVSMNLPPPPSSAENASENEDDEDEEEGDDNDGDDVDEDDDEDYDNHQEEELEAIFDNEGDGADDALVSQHPNGQSINHLYTIFDEDHHPSSRPTSRANSPLILDIGVPLPPSLDTEGEDGMMGEEDYMEVEEGDSFLTEEQRKDVTYLPFASVETAAGKSHQEFSYRHTWRNYWRNVILPRLHTFEPSIIMISAGFDAHKKDDINAGYCSLTEDDFAWVTLQLLLISNSAGCQGRIVSSLEGGYQLGGEYTSAFAKSVCAHVEVLAKLGNGICQREYSYIETMNEKALEEQYLNELRESHISEVKKKREELKMFQSQRDEQLLVESLAMATSHATEAVSDTSAVQEENSRKRRRPPVDYHALDEKIRQEGII